MKRLFFLTAAVVALYPASQYASSINNTTTQKTSPIAIPKPDKRFEETCCYYRNSPSSLSSTPNTSPFLSSNSTPSQTPASLRKPSIAAITAQIDKLNS